MQYDLLGGGHITAASPLEIAEALRQDAAAWLPSVSVEDFMEGMAARCRLQTGATVRTDSAAHFAADLEEQGFITPA